MNGSSTELIRAFVALRPDAVALAELVRVQRELKKRLADSRLRIKWTDPENFHITLLFLGDVFVTDVGVILEKIGALTQSLSMFGTVLEPAGFFKKSGAIWVGMDVPPELLEFQKTLAETLGSESGHFAAHFTIGRIKRGRPVWDFFQCLEGVAVEAVPFNIASVELIRSELLPDGPRYTRLGTAMFAGNTGV